jgi:hypothetical protein
MDQEGDIVARGAHNLADVISQQDDGDMLKAEVLVREAIRIIDQFLYHGAHDGRIGRNFLLLAKILRK